MSENSSAASDNSNQRRANVSISADKASSSCNSTIVEVKEEAGAASFDHLYACNSENGDLTLDASAESEVKFHREWLSFHLDLIQQQSDDLLNKERTILLLRQENDMLKQRLRSIDRNISFQETEFDFSSAQFVDARLGLGAKEEEMTQDSLPSEEDTKTNIKLLDLDCEASNSFPSASMIRETRDENFSSLGKSRGGKGKSSSSTTKNGSVIKVRKDLNKTTPLPDSTTNNKLGTDNTHNNSAPSLLDLNHSGDSVKTIDVSNSSVKSLRSGSRNKRKRLSSSSSFLSNTDSITEDRDRDALMSNSRLRKKIRKSINEELILTCPHAYVTQSGDPGSDLFVEEPEDPPDHPPSSQIALEVPRWRVKVYTSCYQMEGTENLDDDVFNKRHSRLEYDERRRKRWDVQRIREQRIIEKLKQRQERIDSGSRSEEPPEPPSSLWPALEDIQLIEVTESLPVSAFGCPVPRFVASEFSLPWVNHNTSLKKPGPTSSRKSTAKRRSTSKR